VDAVDPAGERALTLILMLGSPFSPSYRRATHASKRPDPLEHAALNVVIHERRRSCFALIEDRAHHRDRHSVELTSSRVMWSGGRVTWEIRERTAWTRSPIRGLVEVTPRVSSTAAIPLDSRGTHLWRPLAPLARVRATFTSPGFDFDGHGYLDSNRGDRPLEQGLAPWSWMHSVSSGSIDVRYDVVGRPPVTLGTAGHPVPADPSDTVHRLPTSRWGLPRCVRLPVGADVAIVRTLEDAPFYVRSLVRIERGRRSVLAVHETMDPVRLAHPLSQWMIPWRSHRGQPRR
jgi:carotenoid 1,2-hydratase